VPDAHAFERFYRENLTRIVWACALVTLDRSLAEDVAAEAFVRLWSRWGSIESDDHAGGFVFKTAMRLCGRELRRRSRRPRRGDVAEDRSIERAMVRRDVAEALALPVRQRQAVVLRDWAGFDSNQTARMLGIRESTLRVHLARARERLRSLLAVHEGVEP
jgi:RNA polymerase sigma factor (sigma-70 family)